MSEQTMEMEELEFDLPLEEEIDQVELTPGGRKIFTDKGDPEVDSLYKKWTKGKLILQPEFQRHFVWDVSKSSRLIESSLLDIPLPVIYLSEEDDGREYVIDGQQRLTAFFSFINGKFPEDQRDFKLAGLKVFPELNGKMFKDIEENAQDKISSCIIRTITFKKESDKNLKFEIFERLNTGAVSLNDQELRNCIFRGPYNKLLNKLSQDKDFMHLLGLKAFDRRMKDVELVLRFAAFYHATYLKYKPPMRIFLNNDMEKYQFIREEEAAELTIAFKNAVAIINSLFGKSAFKRFYKGTDKNPDGYWEPKKFNASLYDVLMYLFAQSDKHTTYQYLDSIREALIYLMTNDKEFIDSIELSTSSMHAVRKRFDKSRMAIEDLGGIQNKEPRCFSLQLKQELYDKDNTCTICGQRINHIDDAAVDHIEQYWTGGKTIPENARLTHRYCNWARPRKEGLS
jgi:hypothetical protein